MNAKFKQIILGIKIFINIENINKNELGTVIKKYEIFISLYVKALSLNKSYEEYAATPIYLIFLKFS